MPVRVCIYSESKIFFDVISLLSLPCSQTHLFMHRANKTDVRDVTDAKDLQSFSLPCHHARDVLAPPDQAAVRSHQHVPLTCPGADSPLPVYPVQEEFTASSPPLVSWEETETEPLGAGLGLCQKLMNPVRRMIQMEKFDTGDPSTEQGLDQESPSCPSPGPWYPASRDHSFWHKDSTGHAVLRC